MQLLPRYVAYLRKVKDDAGCYSGGPEHWTWQWAEVLLALHERRAPRLPPRQPSWILNQCLPDGERQETA